MTKLSRTSLMTHHHIELYASSAFVNSIRPHPSTHTQSVSSLRTTSTYAYGLVRAKRSILG